MTEREEKFKEAVFDWLDRLRDSGKINMFGAAPHLQDAFEMTPKQARHWLAEWMSTYSERHHD